MRVKKLLLILTLIFITNIAFSVVSFAATGTVTGNTVRVREEASTDSEIVTNVHKDDKVTVIEEKDGWYKIQYAIFEGYIYGEYLKVDEEKTEDDEPKKDDNTTKENNESTPTSSTSVESIKIGESYKLKKSSNLYIIPVLYASVIEEMESGASVKVIQLANNWVYVETQKYTGWIAKYAIEEFSSEGTNEKEPEDTKPEETPKPEEPKPEEKEPEPETNVKPQQTTKSVGYVNVEQANVREGPSVDYEHVITAKQNQELKILGEENGWYKVELKGVTGYISKKLVSDEKVEVTPSRGMTEARIPAASEEEEEENIEVQPVIQETPKEDVVVQENNLASEKKEEEKSTPEITGEDIVAYAKKFLGGKYVSGGNTPATGMDCSGYTKYVFKHFGYTLSRTTSGQATNGKEVARSDMQVGDIIIFLNDSKSKIGHVGIYIGNDQFIHSANAKRGIVIDSVYNSYYEPRWVCVRRII